MTIIYAVETPFIFKLYQYILTHFSIYGLFTKLLFGIFSKRLIGLNPQ